MAATAFDALAEALEELTSLSRIESRGTLRLVLKDAGVEPSQPTAQELDAVLSKLLPRELLVRGIDDALDICRSLAERASEFAGNAESRDTPEDVFRRLGA